MKLCSHSLDLEAEYGISLENKLERELGISLESDDGISKLLSDCISLAESQLDELSGKQNATFCALWRTRILDAIKAFDGSIAPKMIRALEFVQSEHKAVPKEMLADLPTPEQFAADINAQ